MDEDHDNRDWMRKNRMWILAVLAQPLVGMAVAIILILWRSPPHVLRTVGIILVIMIQYALLVRWMAGKMDKLGAS